MRKIISFMHISLDGFVAGLNGEMDWIKIDDELFRHVEQRISPSDTALYGRVTFQMMEGYWPTAADKPDATQHDINHSKWYKQIRKLVLSDTLDASEFSQTEVIGNDNLKRLREIRQDEGNEILLFGSPSATHALLEQDLIDGFWLFVNPVVLGKGIPLFKKVPHQLNLQTLPSALPFTSGVTELNYLVVR